MKSIVNLIFALIFIPQMAFASHADAFKEAIDEYHYSLTVQWDQKDQSFVRNQDEILLHKLEVLVEQGLTSQDVRDAFPSINSSRLENDLEKMNFKNMTDVKNFVSESQESYAKGANWSGDAIGISVMILAGVTLVALIISAQVKRENIRKECLATYTGADPGAACANRAGPVQLMPWYVQ